MNDSISIRNGVRFAPTLLAAAAAAVAGFIRAAIGYDQMHWIDPADQATAIPPISEKLVEQYAYAGATDREIADRFLIDPADLQRDYPNVLRVARALRSMSIRGLQYDLAKKLNGPMLTWLGRNELNQSLNPTAPGVAPPGFGVEEF
jgi:hypothetical protein